MRRRLSVAVAFLACAALRLGAADGLAIAREALVDGIPAFARSNAEEALKTATNAFRRAEAQCLILDALMDSSDAEGALARLDEWPDARGEAFRYRRALALSACGRTAEALQILGTPFSDTNYVGRAKALGTYLSARARTAAGDRAGALALLKDATDEESRFYASELMPDSPETRRLRAKLAAEATRPDVRRRTAVRLGLDELNAPETFSNGVIRIQTALAGEPDAPEAFPAFLEIARRLLERGDAVGAEAAYARILATYPESSLDAAVLERRGWALLGAGRRTEAIGAFARAAQVATNANVRTRCLFKRADALFADGRYSDAAQAFAELSVSGGARYADRAAFSAADAYARAGSAKAARALHAGLSSRPGAYRIRAQLRLAAADAAGGRAADAIRVYTDVCTNGAASVVERVTALFGRGRAHYRAYDFRAAADDFARAGALDPKRRDEAAFLGVLCLYGQNRDEAAHAAAEKLLAATTDPVLRGDISLWLARFDFNRGAWDAAQRRFDACAAVRTNGVEAARIRLWCARTALERNEYPEAIAHASAAVGAAGTGAPDVIGEALAVQGEALMEQARFGDAVKVFARIASFSPSEETLRRAGMRRADALFALGADNAACYDAALAAYRELEASGRLTPGERLLAAFQIGRTLEKLRRFQEAEKQYYVHVLMAYEDANDKGVWFDDASRALFARAGFTLADLYESRGATRSAAGVLRHVAEAGVTASDEARRRLRTLESTGRNGK